jgi:chromate transporter
VRELVFLFLKLGITAFGGPAAHIAMMHDEVVRRRGWMTDAHFLDLVGATNLVPGPNSTELAFHLGYQRHGWRGLLAAGGCFIAPAALIVGGLAWAYLQYGQTSVGLGLLYGISPVVVAIIGYAVITLGRTAVTGWLLAGVAAAALAAYLLGLNELVVLAGGGLITVAVRTWRRHRDERTLAALIPLAAGPLFADPGWAVLTRLFLTMLKIGAVLYGSGYVLVAFLDADFVHRLGWLTEHQLLDAVAIGQVTPGPLFTTATFVGYLVAGVPGAIVATVGIFLPALFFGALLNRLVRWIRARTWASAALDGVNAAALALMAGVALRIGDAALVDPLTIVVAVVALVLLWRLRLNSAWLVAGGALIGVVHAVL